LSGLKSNDSMLTLVIAATATEWIRRPTNPKQQLFLSEAMRAMQRLIGMELVCIFILRFLFILFNQRAPSENPSYDSHA